MVEQKEIISEYAKSINDIYKEETNPKLWYPMYYSDKLVKRDKFIWVQENYDKFLKGTPNEVLYNRWYFSEMGFITAVEFAPNGSHIIVAHSSGLIQVNERLRARICFFFGSRWLVHSTLSLSAQYFYKAVRFFRVKDLFYELLITVKWANKCYVVYWHRKS